MNRYIFISILIAGGLIVYGGYASKCSGEECSVKSTDNQIYTQMNPVRGFSLSSSSGTRNTLLTNFGTVVKATGTFNGMNPENIKKQVETGEIFLLDVREEYEWDLGHIAGAKLISLGDINAETTKDLPKNIPLYVYCRSGSRAGGAVAELKQLGFNNAVNIGGIIHWQERGGELVQ